MRTEKKSTGDGTVSLSEEMREAIVKLAGDRAVFDSRDRWIERAARAAGISKRMARSFFYGESNNPSAEAVEKVRAALKNKEKTGHDVSAARHEYQELLARIERLENALRLQPSEPCSAADNAVRRMSGQQNRAVDSINENPAGQGRG